MDPGGVQSLGSPTKRQERVGKKTTGNKPTRAEEGNQRRRGRALQSSCLGSASSHCGHQRATATVEQSTGQLPRCMPAVRGG